METVEGDGQEIGREEAVSVSGNIQAFGREIGKHPDLSQADFAGVLSAVAAALEARASGQSVPAADASLPPAVAEIAGQCVAAYSQPLVSGIECFAEEIARHPGLSDVDYAALLRALARAAMQMDMELWDQVELGRVSQSLPMHLRAVFQTCVQAYDRR